MNWKSTGLYYSAVVTGCMCVCVKRSSEDCESNREDFNGICCIISMHIVCPCYFESRYGAVSEGWEDYCGVFSVKVDAREFRRVFVVVSSWKSICIIRFLKVELLFSCLA